MSRTGGIRRWATSLAIAPLMMLATPISSRAQFTTLVSFTGANGNLPFMENLVQGKNGSLYGTTTYGGTSGNGTIFKVTPTGTLTTIYNFANTPRRANPDAGPPRVHRGRPDSVPLPGTAPSSRCLHPDR